MSKFAVRGHIKRTIRDHSLYDVNDYLPSEDILRCKSNTNRPSFPDMPIASELKQINNDAYEKECN